MRLFLPLLLSFVALAEERNTEAEKAFSDHLPSGAPHDFKTAPRSRRLQRGVSPIGLGAKAEDPTAQDLGEYAVRSVLDRPTHGEMHFAPSAERTGP